MLERIGYMRKRYGFLLILSSLASFLSPSNAAPHASLGMNSNEYSFYGAAIVMKDLMKGKTNRWTAVDKNGAALNGVQLDADGYPLGTTPGASSYSTSIGVAMP